MDLKRQYYMRWQTKQRICMKKNFFFWIYCKMNKIRRRFCQCDNTYIYSDWHDEFNIRLKLKVSWHFGQQLIIWSDWMNWNSGDCHTSDSRISFARSLISCDGFMFSGSSSSCSNRACAKRRATQSNTRKRISGTRKKRKKIKMEFFFFQVSKFENKAEISPLKLKFRE